jgi:hypothetical protein
MVGYIAQVADWLSDLLKRRFAGRRVAEDHARHERPELSEPINRIDQRPCVEEYRGAGELINGAELRSQCDLRQKKPKP